MKKSLRIPLVLCLTMVLFMAAQVQVNAAELPNLKNMNDFKDLNYEKISQPLKDLIKEADEKVTEAVEDNKVKYGGSTKVDVDYSKAENNLLGKVVVIYKDTEGNIIKTMVKTNLELKTYEEKAIGINGFKLISKTSQEIALTENKYEQTVIFIYKKCTEEPEKPGDEDPIKPGDEDPVEPGDEDPEEPGIEDPDKPGDEDPDKPGVEDPDKPGDEDPDKPGDEDPDKPGDEDPDKPGEPRKELPKTGAIDTMKAEENKVNDDKNKLPKTGTSASILVSLGSILALSGGLILKKKK